LLALVVVGCGGSSPGSSLGFESSGAPTTAPSSATAPTVLASLAPTPVETARLALSGRIVFERFDVAANSSAVYLADANGTHVEPLFDRGAEMPHWSPDHKTVSLFCCDDGMAAHLIDVASRAFRELPPPDPVVEVHCGPWTADGLELACESFGTDDESKNGVYAMPAGDGKGLRRLTSNPDGDDLPGDFSSDGKLLVFTRSEDAGGTLYVARLGTREPPIRVSPSGAVGQCFCGTFSPDGSEIAYASALDGGVHLVRPDGGELHKVFRDANGRWAMAPAWSPDGRYIVFALSPTRDVSSHPPTDLYVMNADGSEPGLLLSGDAYQSNPDWAP